MGPLSWLSAALISRFTKKVASSCSTCHSRDSETSCTILCSNDRRWKR